MDRSREADRDRRGELKGEESAEEQVSLSPPLKYRYWLWSAGVRRVPPWERLWEFGDVRGLLGSLWNRLSLRLVCGDSTSVEKP